MEEGLGCHLAAIESGDVEQGGGGKIGGAGQPV